jgi:pimeloyl-ACP methyl ester carboxylesterase
MRPLACAALVAFAACAAAPPPVPAPPPQATRLIPTTRGRILVDDGGRGGLPVILVHGAGGDHAIWGETLAHLRRTRRAIALDLPGFGQSDPPRGGDWSPAALGEDLGRAADALGLSRFVLVLHGFSGTIGLEYAARHPLRVAGLYFLDASGGRRDPGDLFRTAERKAFSPDDWKGTVQARYGPMLAGALEPTRARVQATLDRTSREAFLAAALAVTLVDPAKALARYTGPRYALATQARVLEGIQANVEGFPYRKVEGSSHWIMLDQPEALNAALDEFLAQAK